MTSGGAISNLIDPFGTQQSVPSVIGTPQMVGRVNCWLFASTSAACRAIDPTGTNAFALQSSGQYGNAGRNIIRGVTERAGLEFRWEVFNLSNTVQFGRPNSDLSSGAVGSITSLAADPRIMQFTLRFHF